MKEMILSKRNQLTKKDVQEFGLILAASAIITTIILYCCPFAFAANATTVSMMENVMKILKIIAMVAGALFLVVGLLKFAISHANEDGPAQQKAIMMMATGILLGVIGLTVFTDSFASTIAEWIDQ